MEALVFVPSVGFSAHHVAIEPVDNITRCEWGGDCDRVWVHVLDCRGLNKLGGGYEQLVQLRMTAGDLGL